jgi:hypothetical protein
MQRRWDLVKAIGDNLAVYNRLQCARQLNIELKPIDRLTRDSRFKKNLEA